MTVRIAVLASGSGTNLEAILDYVAKLGDRAAGQVVLAASNRQSAGALERARQRAIHAEVFETGDDGTGLLSLLHHHDIQLVVLAGYLRKIPPAVTKSYHERILNIHPGILPEFGGRGMYGAKVHEAVIASGVRFTGVTVHFVDDEFDHGPTIAQWRLPIHDGETSESLAARVLAVEHVFYPRVVDMVASLVAREFVADL